MRAGARNITLDITAPDEEKTMTTRSAIRRSLLVVLVLAVMTGCVSITMREYVDDSTITAQVKAEILGDPILKAFDIGVETFKGTVQLSGFVNSAETRNQAGVVTSHVSGVQSVQNRLLVQ
jgi:hyperosmotically inducible periplasmic protein